MILEFWNMSVSNNLSNLRCFQLVQSKRIFNYTEQRTFAHAVWALLSPPAQKNKGMETSIALTYLN